MILFAKAPLPGRVKTRLEPMLGAARAARLHAACVREMLEKLKTFQELAEIELHTDIPTDAWREWPVTRKLQVEGDLALRMFHALEQALKTGRPRAMIIGSDAPTLPAGHLRRLLDARADVAFGPAEDGGYYAISCGRVHPRMFESVLWSAPDALERSERAARECGLTVERGDPWYDIDEPADLLRLAKRPEAPAWLSEFLE